MFFSRYYISAVPIREEQRLSEEEELARELKREARIFFPDKKPQAEESSLKPLPKPSSQQEPPLSESGQKKPSEETDTFVPPQKEKKTVLPEAKQIAETEQQRAIDLPSKKEESDLNDKGAYKKVQFRLNKPDLKQGIRLMTILDKPRGLMPWKGDIL